MVVAISWVDLILSLALKHLGLDKQQEQEHTR